MNLEDLTLTEAASQIRDGKLSPVEYAHALFARMDKVEPRVQAWVTIDRGAVLAEARLCEAEAHEKNFRGPLHGIPVGVKDIFYTNGLRTTMGSRRFANFIPDKDAQSVAKLKAAGAIVLGKSVTTEFAFFDAGPTRNPWNTAHTPGGSSSGSAAAVAARMCPAATGSQTVGSIGRPAAFCGVVGLVPTQSRVSRTGVFPVAWTLDHVGGFARNVQDMEMFFGAMSETAIVKTARPERIRIGIIREYFYERMTDEARSLHEALIGKLTAANFEICEIRLPAIFELSGPSLMTIMRTEVAAAHEGLHADNSDAYGPKLRGLIETGMLLDAGTYLRALRIRRVYQKEMKKLFQGADILISPGATGTAPEGLSYTGDPALSRPWTLADFPTLTLPHALAPNGLPVGIQVSAPPAADEQLLEIGKLLEEVIAFTPLNPPMK